MSAENRQKTITALLLTVSVLLAIAFICLSTARAYAVRGNMLLEANNPEGAKSCYEKAVRLDPVNAEYRFVLGQIYSISDAENPKIIQKSEELLSAAISLEPHNAKFSRFAAQMYSSKGDIEKAVMFADKTIQSQPINPLSYEDKAIVYFEAAKFYYGKGQKDKAEDCLKRAIDVENSFEEMNGKLKKPVELSENMKDVIARSIYMLLNIDRPEIIGQLEECINKKSASNKNTSDFVPDGWIYDEERLKLIRSEETLSDAEKRLAYVEKLCGYLPDNPLSYEQKALEYFKAAGEYYYNDNKEKAGEYLQEVLNLKYDMKNLYDKSNEPLVMTDITMNVLSRSSFLLFHIEKPEKIITYYESGRFTYRSLFELDIDENSIPDEWSSTPNLKMNVLMDTNRALKVSNPEDAAGYMESRSINVEKKGKYFLRMAARGSAEQYGVEIIDKVRNISLCRRFYSVDPAGEEFKDIKLEFSLDKGDAEIAIRLIFPKDDGYTEINRIYIFEAAE